MNNTTIPQQNATTKRPRMLALNRFIRQEISQLWWRVLLLIMFIIIVGLLSYAYRRNIKHETNDELLNFLCEQLAVNLGITLISFFILSNGNDFLTGRVKVSVKPTEEIFESIMNKRETKIQVRILDTFIATYIDYKSSKYPNGIFIEAITAAIKNNVKVQILVLHPNSNAAKQRNIDLFESKGSDRKNLQWLMKQNLAKLYSLKMKLKMTGCPYWENLEIVLFNSTPPFPFISWDSNAYMSFFKNETISDLEKGFKLTIESNLGRVIEETFENIYESKRKVDIETYMTVKIYQKNSDELFDHTIYYCGKEGKEDYPNYITFSFDGTIRDYLSEQSKDRGKILLQTESGIETMIVVSQYKPSNENYDLNIQRFKSRYNWDSENEILRTKPPIFELRSLKETRQQKLFHLDSNFVSKLLERKKYVRLPGTTIKSCLEKEHGADDINIGVIKKEWDKLVLDKHLIHDADTNWDFRERRIRFFTYDFELDDIKPSEQTVFEQSRIYPTKTQAAEQRKFALIEDNIFKNEFITSLIRFDLLNMCDNTELTKSKWKGIIHFIRIKARPDLPGKPSPEGVHSDGHDLLAIHLLEKSGSVKGAVNHLYTNQATQNPNDTVNAQYLIEQVPLYQFLDTLYIRDKDVKHYATDLVCKDSERPGYRDVIIIDFERKPN